MAVNTPGRALKHSELFNVWTETPLKIRAATIEEKLRGTFPIQGVPDENWSKFARMTCLSYDKMWNKYLRSRSKVTKYKESFLSTLVSFPDYCLPQPSHSQKTGVGAPQKRFSDCGAKTKKLKVGPLLAYSAEELHFAARMKSPSAPVNTRVMSVYETLALTLDLDLSERKYDILRKFVNNVHAGMMPSLYSLNNFKKQFLPKIMYASDTRVQVDTQDMINKTISSFFLMLEKEILKNYCASSEFVVVFKWGMDGSSGHSTNKLPFRDEINTDQGTDQNTDQESDHDTDSGTDQNTKKDPNSQTGVTQRVVELIAISKAAFLIRIVLFGCFFKVCATGAAAKNLVIKVSDGQVRKGPK
ncbi:unnamed protein product [Bemisia tabaci]|uniref:Uncharacterized protein n=1 Tax=Bemisia tabaci TaxID=7038 RepID=A0A9P0F3P2_BEMTA|nr:unnamed protein product [Bemisia tabaci]